MSGNTDGRTWYLRDEPLEYLDEEDLFRHKSYVQILLATVAEVSPPFTLGIFGSWGVGKTSIVNDLKHSMATDDEFKSLPVVVIDIWKYEADNSLRRQFLIDMQSQLKRAKTPLPKCYDVEAQLYRPRAIEVQAAPRLSLRGLKEATPLLLLVPATIGVLWLSSELSIARPWQYLISALVLPFLFHIFRGVSRNFIIEQKVTTTEPALFSSEQFEKAFEDMVGETLCEKMVIIIDNLDRCSRDRVVEVLGVVKTYLEPKGKDKCIFIIPCDDSAIKKQVKAAYQVPDRGAEKTDAEGYADEYLRKFFNTSIRITPFIEKEIEPYVETLLNKLRLTERMPDEQAKQLVQMISLVFRKNPRRIKQFLNNLSAKYLLVKEREAGDPPMIQPRISDKLLFLTKVSIIETKFPEQFQDFLADDNLYREVVGSLNTRQEAEGKVAAILKDDELWHFLLFTKDVTAENHRAFFHLKQSPHEAKILNYDDFWNAVRSGQREVVSDLFQKGTVESKQAALDEIVAQVRDNAQKGYFEYAAGAINVGCAISPTLSSEDQRRLSHEVIGTLASYPDIRGKLSSLVPAEVFALMPHALRSDSDVVKGQYVSLYSEEPPTEAPGRLRFQLGIAEAIVKSLEQLSPSQLETMRNATDGFPWIPPDLFLIVSSTDEAKARLVTSPLVARAVEGIQVEEVRSFAGTEESTQRHAPLIEFVLRCQDLAEGDTATLWGQKLTELLELSVNENDSQLEAYAHRCIDESEVLLGKAESSAVDQLAHLLRQRYSQADDHRRLAIVLTLCALYDYCSGSHQTETKNLVVNEFVGSEPPVNVAQFLATQEDKQFEGRPYYTAAIDRLAHRVASEGDEKARRQILSSCLDVDGTRRIELLVRLLGALIARPEVSVSVPLVWEFSKEFPPGNRGKGLVAPILKETIHPSRGSIPVPEKKSLLELAIYLREWHTRGFEADFDRVLVELLTSDDPSSRQLGLDVLDTAHRESALPRERRMKVLGELATSLAERKPSPDDSIMQQLSSVVDAKHDVIPAALALEIVEYLRQLIRPGGGVDYRRQSLLRLSSFSGLPRGLLEELVPELVGHAESEGDPTTRNALEDCLLSLRRGNTPLDRDLWEDFYHYIRTAAGSPNETRRQRGNDLSRQMRQVTSEARKQNAHAEPPSTQGAA